MRILLGVEKEPNPYLCPSCKVSHLPNSTERVKVVVSDSTLHQFYAPPGYTSTNYPGDIVHTDYISIPGAGLGILTHAFKHDYMQDRTIPRALDVVMVAGYNDLVEGLTREYILNKFTEFAEMVLDLRVNNNPDLRCTVAIAGLMYPPQLVWYPDNNLPKPPNYRNNMEKIHWLNYHIMVLNKRHNVPLYPRFCTYGVRKSTSISVDQYGQEHHRVTKSHRWEHWREIDPARMLHLRNDRRFKMGTAVQNYFVHNT